jgi:hypothetical protein
MEFSKNLDSDIESVTIRLCGIADQHKVEVDNTHLKSFNEFATLYGQGGDYNQSFKQKVKRDREARQIIDAAMSGLDKLGYEKSKPVLDILAKLFDERTIDEMIHLESQEQKKVSAKIKPNQSNTQNSPTNSKKVLNQEAFKKEVNIADINGQEEIKNNANAILEILPKQDILDQKIARWNQKNEIAVLEVEPLLQDQRELVFNSLINDITNLKNVSFILHSKEVSGAVLATFDGYIEQIKSLENGKKMTIPCNQGLHFYPIGVEKGLDGKITLVNLNSFDNEDAKAVMEALKKGLESKKLSVSEIDPANKSLIKQNLEKGLLPSFNRCANEEVKLELSQSDNDCAIYTDINSLLYEYGVTEGDIKDKNGNKFLDHKFINILGGLVRMPKEDGTTYEKEAKEFFNELKSIVEQYKSGTINKGNFEVQVKNLQIVAAKRLQEIVTQKLHQVSSAIERNPAVENQLNQGQTSGAGSQPSQSVIVNEFYAKILDAVEQFITQNESQSQNQWQILSSTNNRIALHSSQSSSNSHYELNKEAGGERIPKDIAQENNSDIYEQKEVTDEDIQSAFQDLSSYYKNKKSQQAQSEPVLLDEIISPEGIKIGVERAAPHALGSQRESESQNLNQSNQDKNQSQGNLQNLLDNVKTYTKWMNQEYKSLTDAGLTIGLTFASQVFTYDCKKNQFKVSENGSDVYYQDAAEFLQNKNVTDIVDNANIFVCSTDDEKFSNLFNDDKECKKFAEFTDEVDKLFASSVNTVGEEQESSRLETNNICDSQSSRLNHDKSQSHVTKGRSSVDQSQSQSFVVH